ncbi:ATP phosphoribosyltransferase regulatory subunit [Methylophaga pinxianii]|uniref:ATP phosphoribosyltransferase regulatory subunit n=1 Tax=Methylophaga pinxianii TaxID=2881052 RepID=UPI001CF134BC|nr:ATP phosphoribosyltransferase regulatory subunit [Methylophaga pinxianii]MCB2426869.1 ATP phosphoribosyltransferase regulatory subunit [Methylophaga pinxianii]UPH47018.1 ATP phosphoribosyltransferase regulatory subunit [Methylophaga pinxianii]
MTLKESWLLPEGIDELMPEEAAQLERMHRQLVDRMQSWGYQLVVPPLVEYLDSLLTGTAKTLDLQTFKLIDQLSGRLLGIRADMTPQVARIAAHRLRDNSNILRLCYIGSVLHTLPAGQTSSRNPIQLGAEIYGHAGPESDMEIIQLMIELLEVSGVSGPISLDIGHVGIYRGLADFAELDDEQEQALFSAMQRKALPEILKLLSGYAIAEEASDMLAALSELNGDVSVLDKAKQTLQKAPAPVLKSLDSLILLAEMAQQRLPDIQLNFDLAELRGYHYHTGVVFAAYQSNSAQAIALGGRYDDIGQDFGHAQPATGFSLDLKKLVTSFPKPTEKRQVISTVWSADPQQLELVADLREQGHIVVFDLPGSTTHSEKTLIQQDGHWQVVETGNNTRG